MRDRTQFPGRRLLIVLILGSFRLGRVADALIGHRILSPEMTRRVLSGVIDADYGGRDGYGFETRLINGVGPRVTAGPSRGR